MFSASQNLLEAYFTREDNWREEEAAIAIFKLIVLLIRTKQETTRFGTSVCVTAISYSD